MRTIRVHGLLPLVLLGVAPLASAQESKAILDAPVVVSPYYRFGCMLDLDGDGWQDALGWWWSSATNQHVTLAPMLNDRQGAFVTGTTVSFTPGSGSTPVGLVSIRKCDVDHDAREDFYVVFNRAPGWNGTTSVNVFRTTASGTPALVPGYTLNGNSARVGAAVADLDLDGTLDVVFAHDAQLDVYSFTVDGSGVGHPTLRSSLSLPGVTDELFTIDANADGHPDVYVDCGGTGWIVPIVDFQPQTPVVVSHGISTMPMPVAGDIDGDGDEDLVVFDMSAYVVVRRTGPASWNMESARVGGPATYLCDVDQDGDLDGLCCGGGTPSTPYNRGPSTFRVSLNDGRGNFAPAFEMPGLGSDHLTGAADLDHDGDVDLMAGRCVYYAHGKIDAPVMPSLVEPAKDRASVCDFDGDGDPDFRFAWHYLKRNDGTGTSSSFLALTDPVPAGQSNQGPGWFGDFDGDGDVDLLVRRYAGSTLLGTWLYTNNGGGGFTDAGLAGPSGYDIAYAYPGMSYDRAIVADVDGDGDLDLLVHSPTSSVSMYVYKNDGHGRFFDAPLSVTNCNAVAVADFDADGKLDLLNIYPQPSAFFGAGDGTFTAGPAFGNPSAIYFGQCADVGDLDGDGDVDVVLAATTGNMDLPADVCWNDGTGHFTRVSLTDAYIDTYPSGRAANAVDLNGDGRLDLVVGPASLAWSAAWVILRKSDNSGWETPIQQTIYAEDATSRTIVHKATVVDVDSDGDVDLVTDRVIRDNRWNGLAHGKRVQKTNAIAGTGGMEPTLGEVGHFEVGGTTTIRLTGACGNAHGELSAGWVGSQTPVFPGNGPIFRASPMRQTSLLSFTTSGATGVAGVGSWSLTYQVPAYKAGRTYVYRATIEDLGSPTGLAASNDLYVTYGL